MMRGVEATSITKQAQVAAALDQDVAAWIAARRTHRYQPSWQHLADEIEELTGVAVSRETVRLWATA